MPEWLSGRTTRQVVAVAIAGVAIAAAVVLFPLHAATLKRDQSRTNWCANLFTRQRHDLIEAERLPPTSTDNAYKRYEYVDIADALGAGNGGGIFGGYTENGLTISRAVTVGVDQACGRNTANRFDTYALWGQILIDQAQAVFLPDKPSCQKLKASFVDLKIATSAVNLGTRVQRKRGDADIRHVEQILLTWAKANGVTLPPLTDSAALERSLSHYDNQYETELAKAPAGC